MRWILLLLVVLTTGCKSRSWWTPSRIGWYVEGTNVDHDHNLYDGQNLTVGVRTDYSVGLERDAYQRMAELDDLLLRARTWHQADLRTLQDGLLTGVRNNSTRVIDAVEDFDPVQINAPDDSDKVEVIVNPAGPVEPVDPDMVPPDNPDVDIDLSQQFSDPTPTSWTTPPNFFWAAMGLLIASVGLAYAHKSGLRIPFIGRREANGNRSSNPPAPKSDPPPSEGGDPPDS